MSQATALTIAGSDPSGGAGLQADLKMFQHHGVYGMSVVTLITVQNTREVSRVEVLPDKLVAEQLESVLSDIPVGAAKTGALGSKEIIKLTARETERWKLKLIVDPVLVSTHGAELLSPDARDAMISELAPRSYLFTPNLAEAELLTGLRITSLDEMVQAAESLHRIGVENVLIKGGHLEGEATDVLSLPGGVELIRAERINTPHTHGTGCALSAAITARLSRGEDLPAAVRGAKKLIAEGIRRNPGLGHGRGPISFFVSDKLN